MLMLKRQARAKCFADDEHVHPWKRVILESSLSSIFYNTSIIKVE